ncbi:MAG: sigma 54-interacting transcriptional regulator [Peptococcaceae bacterium]|nr:sigma 54-interacting transcriptional regulator [Peptococcaceae bacterium]MDH7524259.1 sigma 54-interacting transcriptional regulator [Peptococcaceae bacterium]
MIDLASSIFALPHGELICVFFPLNQALRKNSSIGEAFSLFGRTGYYTLPVLDAEDKLIGVVNIKDIFSQQNPGQPVAPFISRDFLSFQRPVSDLDLIQAYQESKRLFTEVFITDFNGNLVDIVSMLSFLKTKIAGNEITTEEQFLKQILRPTSLAKCILDDLHDGVVIVDKNSRILYANRAYGIILGVDVNKVINNYLTKIEPEARILNILASGEPFVGKIIKVKSLNIVILANITPIKFRGEVVGAISVFSDVTKITNVAAELERINIVNQLLTQEMGDRRSLPDSFEAIVGTSKKLFRQLEFAVKVSSIDSPVLILGESGTGKELLARAIHFASPRKEGPFISLNCAAIPENLLESELFGYEEGAFSGAKKGGKAGKLEQAHGGTLFLDEIGDMPLPMQTKLLRFLQEKEFERVGGVNPIKVDIRVISATNKNIGEMVEQRIFREDLYYRINVFTIKLPPLRERKIDILALLESYKQHYENKYKKHVNFSPDCLRFLLNYHWPGNVRELKNVVEHAVIMGNGLVTADNLPGYIKESGTSRVPAAVDSKEENSLGSKLKDLEKRTILDALEQSNYNKTQAIKILGISRRTFYKKLKELGI